MKPWSAKKRTSLMTLLLFSCYVIGGTIDSQDSSDPMTEAMKLFMQRDYEKAIPILNRFVEQNQGNPLQKAPVSEALYLLAKIHFELRDDKKAVDAIRRLLALAPEFDREESNGPFKRMFLSYRDDPLAKGKACYSRGDFEQAVRILEEFIGMNPVDGEKREALAEAHYVLAKVFFESRDDPMADLHLRKTLQLSPDFSTPESNPGFRYRFNQMKSEGNREKDRQAESGPEKKTAPEATVKEEMGSRRGAGKELQKKRRIPWLLIAVGAVALGVVVYMLLKKTTYTLNVSLGVGVSGSPGAATYTHKKGERIPYHYSMNEGYKNLSVLLDGVPMSASGEIRMDQDHRLSALADLLLKYVLNVTVGVGAEGTPGTGIHEYPEGTTVEYSYRLKSGYTDLTVKIDGNPVPVSGSVTMTGKHGLVVDAREESPYCTLVIKYSGWSTLYGGPSPGTYTYPRGTRIDFYYYTNCSDPYWAPILEVFFNGSMIASDSQSGPVSGSIILDRDSTLTISQG